MEDTNKDQVRSALLAIGKPRCIEIEHGGVRFMVRQPNTRISRAIDSEGNIFEKLIRSVIECVHTVGPDGSMGDRVFRATDAEALMEQPADSSSLIGKVADGLKRLSNQQEMIDSAKNS